MEFFYKKCLLTISAFFLITSVNAQNPSQFSEQSITGFTTMDLNQKEFFVIAHRGASAYYPENTLSAFEAAIEMNADMIELDVLITKDNVPIVFHDEKLDQKTNGKGLVVDHILAEIKKLDAGSWFGEKFKNERIPTLREALELTKDKILVNIEIKTEAVTDRTEPGIVKIVLDLVEELQMSDQVIISSFDYRVLERIRNSNSSVKVAMLYERRQSYGREPVVLVDVYGVDAFNVSNRELADSWVTQLNDNNIPFFVYTVNDPALMRSLIRKGAKGIFTDKPDVLIDIVDEVINKNWQ